MANINKIIAAYSGSGQATPAVSAVRTAAGRNDPDDHDR